MDKSNQKQQTTTKRKLKWMYSFFVECTWVDEFNDRCHGGKRLSDPSKPCPNCGGSGKEFKSGAKYGVIVTGIILLSYLVF